MPCKALLHCAGVAPDWVSERKPTFDAPTAVPAMTRSSTPRGATGRSLSVPNSHDGCETSDAEDGEAAANKLENGHALGSSEQSERRNTATV